MVGVPEKINYLVVREPEKNADIFLHFHHTPFINLD